MLKKASIICAIALSTISILSSAQNNTNSPYTRYGYGELADNTSGRSKSMGGTAIGMRSKATINSINPASYSSIDSMTFMYEMGVGAKQSKFTNETQSLQSFTGNLEYINIQLPLGKYIAFSGGIQPFSFVGYDLSKSDSVAIPTSTGSSMMYYTANYVGTGSTNQVYAGLSGKIGKHLSVGVNFNYLFGSINHQRQLTFDSDNSEIASSSTTRYTSSLSIRDFNLRYGVQYYTPLNSNSNITVGAIFENKSQLGGNYTLIDYTGNQDADTTKQDNNSDFETPITFGLGLSYEYKNKLIVGADVLFQNWADTRFFGVTDTLKNRTKISVGGEYRHNPNAKNYLARMTYRLGANMSTGYLNVNGESPANMGLSLGFGFPARGNRSLINLGVEYGRIGKVSAKQIQEDYFKFSLSATFNEAWFFKRKIE